MPLKNRKYIEICKENNIIFAIDEQNYEEITNFLAEKDLAGKLQRIFEHIIRGSAVKDIYEYYLQYQVGAIKFKGKKGNNARIYCKDYKGDDENRIVILCELLKSKKRKKILAKTKTLINKVRSYEYK